MNILLCGLCLSALFSEILPMQIIKGDTNTTLILLRNKRQDRNNDEMWSWGIVSPGQYQDLITKASITATEATVPETPANPCEQPLLVKPDFRAPGRSISETKCYEYIWGIKFREDRHKKQKECKKYQNELDGTFSIAAIGGRETLTGEFPHMAAIGWKPVVGTWVFKCGGSLISPNFVLTAAHCTRASPIDTSIADVVPKIVRLGDKNIIDTTSNNVDPTDVDISRIIIHPKYKAPKKYFDIALMELKSEVEFDSLIQPACLFTKMDTRALGSKATLTGWGVVETAGRTTSPELQAADVDIMDNQQCDQLLRPMCNRNWCGIQNHQICAGKLAGGVDACQGDSGGPLQVEIPLPSSTKGRMHYVIGVTSFGFGCALANTPGVYTRVSSFREWIEGNVWK